MGSTADPNNVRFGSKADIAVQLGMSALPPDADVALDKYLARTDKIALAAIAKLERGVK